MAARFLRMKFKNVSLNFNPETYLQELDGFSYAELERVCVQAIKTSIIDRKNLVEEKRNNFV